LFTIDFSDHTSEVNDAWFTQIDELLTFADKDKVTDVISFAFEEEDAEIVGADIPRVLGDIIICTDVAKEQAEQYGHSFERELGFLALHGFLHLLGYDHIEQDDEKVMFGRQDEILNAYGLTRDK
jgi:probable rRNA maturation factor